MSSAASLNLGLSQKGVLKNGLKDFMVHEIMIIFSIDRDQAVQT